MTEQVMQLVQLCVAGRQVDLRASCDKISRLVKLNKIGAKATSGEPSLVADTEPALSDPRRALRETCRCLAAVGN